MRTYLWIQYRGGLIWGSPNLNRKPHQYIFVAQPPAVKDFDFLPKNSMEPDRYLKWCFGLSKCFSWLSVGCPFVYNPFPLVFLLNFYIFICIQGFICFFARLNYPSTSAITFEVLGHQLQFSQVCFFIVLFPYCKRCYCFL